MSFDNTIKTPVNNAEYNRDESSSSNASPLPGDVFARLAASAAQNPHAIVICQSAEADDLGVKSSWNSLTLFFSKIVSWIKDGASNKLIKAQFIAYVNAKIGDNTDGQFNEVKANLDRLVNPNSRGSLDLCVVSLIVNGLAQASGQLLFDQPLGQALSNHSDKGERDISTTRQSHVPDPFMTPQLPRKGRHVSFSSEQIISQNSVSFSENEIEDEDEDELFSSLPNLGSSTPESKNLKSGSSQNSPQTLAEVPPLATPRVVLSNPRDVFIDEALQLVFSAAKERLKLGEGVNVTIHDITSHDILTASSSSEWSDSHQKASHAASVSDEPNEAIKLIETKIAQLKQQHQNQNLELEDGSDSEISRSSTSSTSSIS